MQYWVMKDGVQQGPMDLNGLKEIGITGETYVWSDGMDDWAQAKNVADLHSILNLGASKVVDSPKKEEVEPEEHEAETPVEETHEEPKAESESEEASAQEEALAQPEEPKMVPPQPNTPPNQYYGQQVYPQQPQQYPYYGQQPYNYQQHEPQTPKCPPTYLALSIILTILCCQITGVIAIIYSASVSSKYRAGDYMGAQKASDRAGVWCIVSIVLGLIALPVIIALQLLTL